MGGILENNGKTDMSELASQVDVRCDIFEYTGSCKATNQPSQAEECQLVSTEGKLNGPDPAQIATVLMRSFPFGARASWTGEGERQTCNTFDE